MDKGAYRWAGAPYCKKHYPGPVEAMDENKIIKREALIGQTCAACVVPFLADGPEPEHGGSERRFREQWQRDIEASRALPIAGDLFGS